MKSNKKHIIIILTILLICSILSLFSFIGCYPTTDSELVYETSEQPTGFAGFFARYGTWIWCGFLLTVFLIPAIVISLVIYFVAKKSIDKKVLEEKKLKGLNPKSKSAAVILSIFFSFWSWLYTYKINFKKFWIIFSIFFAYLIGIISISVQFDPANIFTKYGTWIWLFWLLYSGSVWLWALLDNSLKPTSFYVNYPKGFDLEEDNLHEPITRKEVTVTKNKDSNSIFCMKCGTKLPSTAVYCKKCGQKVE